ncbi:N-acetylmuramoyl-L-alanine amidase AmiC precursor [compost metagenome]
MIPLATLSDGMGYKYDWAHETKTVTVYSGGDQVVLKINDNTASVNGQPVTMQTTAQLIGNRTMVPLSFIGTQFGLSFEWKHVEKEVHMYEPVQVPGDNSQVPDVGTGIPGTVEPPAESAATAGWIKEISYDGINTIIINYEGTVKANKPLYLENPKRIVFDFPATAYSSELTALFQGSPINTLVSDNPLLQSFRYSMFTLEPSATARLVLDVTDGTGYVMSEDVGQIRLQIMPLSEVPAPPVEETDEDPVVTPPTDDGIFDIVIDPGHGGKDPGAASVIKRNEKEFNLSVALKIKALIEKEPKLRVHLTRSDDTYPELIDRVKFAEDLKADLFISIHANSILDKPSVSGTETYYSRPESKAFADVIHKHMLLATGLKDRKVKQANYKVIKETTMPAILLEAGYLSNTGDAQKLFTESVQDRIASEVVAGIKEYLNLK